MKKLLLIPLLIAMVLFAGCASVEEPQTVPPVSTPEVTPTPTGEVVPEIVAPVIVPVIVPDTTQLEITRPDTPVPDINISVVAVIVPETTDIVIPAAPEITLPETPLPEVSPDTSPVPTTLQA